MSSNVQAKIIKEESMEDTIMTEAPIYDESGKEESIKEEKMIKMIKMQKTVKNEGDSEDKLKRSAEEIELAKLRSVTHCYHDFG